MEVSKLINEEKEGKKAIKNKKIELMKHTKKIIENLTDEQANSLLKEKWITPIINGIYKISEDVINDFAKRLKILSEKYETTLLDLEDEITKSEKELSNMIDELDGNEFDLQGLAELRSLLGGN